MPEGRKRQRVGGSALTTPHFLLLFAAMLVAAAGNTALQSVMPAIGRAMRRSGRRERWISTFFSTATSCAPSPG